MSSITTTTEDIGMNRSLPEELVEKILLRLPAKSLVGFKLVCKLWRSLITDRSFAKKHLRSNLDNKSYKRNIFLFWSGSKVPLVDINDPPPITQGILLINASRNGNDDDDDDGSLSCVIGGPDLPRSVSSKLARSKDCKFFLTALHCNGIICVAESHRSKNPKIVLINPALRQLKRFTRPSLHPKRYEFVGEGFGHDSRADDLKFVVVWRVRGRREHTARVYSLRNDSWKEVRVDKGLNLFLFGHDAAYHGGVYYWRNLAVEENSEDMVVGFDFSEEKFWRVTLPDSIGVLPLYWLRLALWKDSVVVFNMIENSPESTVFEMWVMVDKFGGSWTKHLTIGPLTNTQNPLWFWNDDELLMGTMEREIVSFNLDTKKLRTLPTGDAIPPASYHLEYYTESLVSVIERA